VSRFLLDLSWPGDVALKPVPVNVVLHTPCTLRDAAAPAGLLRKIPGLGLSLLPDQPACCGAAGTYGLDRADWAARLRDEIVGSVADADVVATSNVGCAGHLRAGLAEAGKGAVEVLHPVALLARSL
ncbi:(Fe-S)-binding protein, partial [Methylogaea oryzae]